MITPLSAITHIYTFNPLSPHDALKHHSTPLKTYLIFFTAKGFRRQISSKLFHEYIVFFFNLPPISNHLHPLQVENCDSSSRLVVDEDDNGKFRIERVKPHDAPKNHFAFPTNDFLWNCSNNLTIFFHLPPTLT